jgi:protein-disulfide isomerase
MKGFERIVIIANGVTMAVCLLILTMVLREHREIAGIRAALQRQSIVRDAGASRREQRTNRNDSATVRQTGAAVLGSSSAPTTMIYFTDYACPYCRRFSRETMPRLYQEINAGRLRLVVRDLPLHTISIPAAVAARCAGRQQAYWAFHDALFAQAEKLDSGALVRAARASGVKLAAWRKCLYDKEMEHAVRQDGEQAFAEGLTGTPSFVVVQSSKETTVRGRLLIGALPAGAFTAALAQAAQPDIVSKKSE